MASMQDTKTERLMKWKPSLSPSPSILSWSPHLLACVSFTTWPPLPGKSPPPAESVAFECPSMSRCCSFHVDLTHPGPSVLCMIVLHWNGSSFVLLSMIFIFWGSILISFLFPFLSSMSAAPRFVSSIHLVAVVALLHNTAFRSWHTRTQPPTLLPSTPSLRLCASVPKKSQTRRMSWCLYPIRVKIPFYRQPWQNWDLSPVFLRISQNPWPAPHPRSSSWSVSRSTAPAQTSLEVSPRDFRR